MFHHQKRHHLQNPGKFLHQNRQQKNGKKLTPAPAPSPAPKSTTVPAKPPSEQWWSISTTTEPSPPPAPSAQLPSAATPTHLLKTELQHALRGWQLYSDAGRGRQFWTQSFFLRAWQLYRWGLQPQTVCPLWLQVFLDCLDLLEHHSITPPRRTIS